MDCLGMRPRVVVVGSVNMDLSVRVPAFPRPGETLQGRSLVIGGGGKGANQAVAAARYGGRVHLVARVGDDVFGPQLLEQLSRDGVDLSQTLTLPGQATGTAHISVTDAGENAILIVPGANAALTPAEMDACRPLIASADVVLIQLEIPLETAAHVVAMANEHGVLSVLDPAPMPDGPLPEGLLRASVISPNESEAAMLMKLLGVEGDFNALARVLFERGVKLLVLKQGSRGATAYRPDAPPMKIEAIPVNVVDTTAAGDSFTAALALKLAQEIPLAEALRFAAAAGALTTTRPGAQQAIGTAQEVMALLEGSSAGGMA